MNTPARGFPVSEFERRLGKAQEKMAVESLAGMLFTTEPEMRYFSGFQTLFWQSPTRPWYLFVPADGKPVAVIPDIGAHLMRHTWLDDIRTWSAPNPSDDGLSLLTELLAPMAESAAKVGMMKGHETFLRMPLAGWERLCGSLERIEFCDCTNIVRSLRMVKSNREIEKIAHICAIASRAFGAAGELFHEGQPLTETFRSFRRHCLAEGADDVPYLVGGAGPGGYLDVISPPDETPLGRGDVLMLDTGSVFDGYFCDFDRNFAFGDADAASKKAYDVLWRATKAGLAAARPGVRCGELFRVMRSVIRELDGGSGGVGRLGHGLGMQLTEWPSHAPFDNTVLEENMVVTLEPSLAYGDGMIMVHEENIVIRDGEPRLLSVRAPRELPIIGQD